MLHNAESIDYSFKTSLACYIAYEDMQAFDFLASCPQVDPKRVAIVSFHPVATVANS
ncbi:MAG: hypothetical protein CENE_02594 [Candidatus Celerinatantimonas neptuna]|nr:MAG: hypothetical protein CENE_02594 [Candidatus Celerinatantimonas neptuna]